MNTRALVKSVSVMVTAFSIALGGVGVVSSYPGLV